MEQQTARTPVVSGHDPSPRDRHDCLHPGMPHRHGTRAAYVADNCHCTPCRVANRAAEQHRTAALRKGSWQPYVDAEPVRAHLNQLRKHGVVKTEIAVVAAKDFAGGWNCVEVVCAGVGVVRVVLS